MRTPQKFAVVGVAVAGLVLGAGGVMAATGNGHSRSQDAPFHFPKNRAGMTYGSGLNAVSPANLPDLVSAIGVGGTAGYVRSSDLTPPVPSSPADAAKLAATGRTIPLYAVDGTTVIGQFQLTAPTTTGAITTP